MSDEIQYEDRALTCVECQSEFTFTKGEQRYYADREYTAPKRCKICRDARKAKRDDWS